MRDYKFSKIFAILVGVLTIIGALGFGMLAFIGLGLADALNSSIDRSTEVHYSIGLFLFLLILGILTMMGGFKLKNKAWNTFFIIFCLILSLSFIVLFILSFGAFGIKNEYFILLIGLTYLVLTFLVAKHF